MASAQQQFPAVNSFPVSNRSLSVFVHACVALLFGQVLFAALGPVGIGSMRVHCHDYSAIPTVG